MKRKSLFISVIVGVMLMLLFMQYQTRQNGAWNPWSLPLSGKVIYLDPGHGGADGGAEREDVLEKDLSLAVSLKVRDYLQEQGALVLMIREDDRDLAPPEISGFSKRKTADLKKRLKLINDSEADIYVSIHLNAIPSPKWSGAQTFFSPHLEENKRIATMIQEELIISLGNTTRDKKPIQNVYIVKHAQKPGALVEIGFLSNPEERKQLQKGAYQEKVSAAIYRGISRYFTEEEVSK